MGTSSAQSLREQANKSGILVGAAVNPSLFAEAPYASLLAREFNMLEPENMMKWGAIRPNRETYNFKPGDRVVDFAKAHWMKVRGHCLPWHKYNPAWLSEWAVYSGTTVGNPPRTHHDGDEALRGPGFLVGCSQRGVRLDWRDGAFDLV